MKDLVESRARQNNSGQRRPASRRVSQIAILSIIAGTALAGPSAFAQSAIQIQQLQEQIKQLQTQLDAVKTKQAVDEQKATATAATAAAAVATADASSIPVTTNGPGSLQVGRFNFKLGGFTEFATIYRTRNEVGDVGTDFTGIPLNNSPQGPGIRAALQRPSEPPVRHGVDRCRCRHASLGLC
ncbi:MAG: hypothetical protein WDN69_35490 [Aliidongia sp.]